MPSTESAEEMSDPSCLPPASGPPAATTVGRLLRHRSAWPAERSKFVEPFLAVPGCPPDGDPQPRTSPPEQAATSIAMAIATRDISEGPSSGERAAECRFDLGVEREVVVSGLPQHDGLGEITVRDPPDVADGHARPRFVHEIPVAGDGLDVVASARVRNDRFLELTAIDDRPSRAQVGQCVVRVASSIDDPLDFTRGIGPDDELVRARSTSINTSKPSQLNPTNEYS